jgi:hypothetical protein
LVCDAGGTDPPPEPTDTPPPPDILSAPQVRNIFQENGNAWVVRYDGGPSRILLPSKGAAYLNQLLAQPGVPIPATELACRISGNPAAYLLSNGCEVIDPEAGSAYLARYADLMEEWEEAKRNQDDATQRRIEPELDILGRQIEVVRDRRGRLRRVSDTRERVRKKVGNAIRRAVKEIAKFDSRLAHHLRHPRLTCGRNPCYQPGPDMTWET